MVTSGEGKYRTEAGRGVWWREEDVLTCLGRRSGDQAAWAQGGLWPDCGMDCWQGDIVLHHCHVNDLANIVISILRYCKTLAMLSSHQEVTWKELQKSLLIVSLACSPLRRWTFLLYTCSHSIVQLSLHTAGSSWRWTTPAWRRWPRPPSGCSPTRRRALWFS